jgi:hypothetical protein
LRLLVPHGVEQVLESSLASMDLLGEAARRRQPAKLLQVSLAVPTGLGVGTGQGIGLFDDALRL